MKIERAPELEEALREHLSAEAIAAIAAYLQPAGFHRPPTPEGRRAIREVEWFMNLLTEMLGAREQHRLMEEIGL